MGTIYSYHENADAAATAGDTDLIPITTGGVVKTVTPKVLQQTVGGVVDTIATTYALAQATNANRVLTLSATSACAVTIPAATGSGDRYTIQVQVAATGTAHTIVCTGDDVLQGLAIYMTTSAPGAEMYATTATSDKMTINGTTQGGVAGAIVYLQDVAADTYSVLYFSAATGTEVTPFSAT